MSLTENNIPKISAKHQEINYHNKFHHYIPTDSIAVSFSLSSPHSDTQCSQPHTDSTLLPPNHLIQLDKPSLKRYNLATHQPDISWRGKEIMSAINQYGGSQLTTTLPEIEQQSNSFLIHIWSSYLILIKGIARKHLWGGTVEVDE